MAWTSWSNSATIDGASFSAVTEMESFGHKLLDDIGVKDADRRYRLHGEALESCMRTDFRYFFQTWLSYPSVLLGPSYSSSCALTPTLARLGQSQISIDDLS